MTDVALFALVALYVVTAIVCAALAHRVERAEERLADLRLRVFVLAEKLVDEAEGFPIERRAMEALFPEIVRFEPIAPHELRDQDGAA